MISKEVYYSLLKIFKIQQDVLGRAVVGAEPAPIAQSYISRAQFHFQKKKFNEFFIHFGLETTIFGYFTFFYNFQTFHSVYFFHKRKKFQNIVYDKKMPQIF